MFFKAHNLNFPLKYVLTRRKKISHNIILYTHKFSSQPELLSQAWRLNSKKMEEILCGFLNYRSRFDVILCRKEKRTLLERRESASRSMRCPYFSQKFAQNFHNLKTGGTYFCSEGCTFKFARSYLEDGAK